MKKFIAAVLAATVMLPAAAQAELPWQTERHTRYMAIGDSLTAGFGAVPVTEGYAYVLYRSGAFNTVPHTLFCNAAVPGATSTDLLLHQVPQAVKNFRPDFITLTIGGNDLLTLLGDPQITPEKVGGVLNKFSSNLAQSLSALLVELPTAKIYLGNLYAIPELPVTEQVVPVFNTALTQTVQGVKEALRPAIPDVDSRLVTVDIYSAFQGKSGLLLIERNGAALDQIHPTNAGYRVMSRAFEDAIVGAESK